MVFLMFLDVQFLNISLQNFSISACNVVEVETAARRKVEQRDIATFKPEKARKDRKDRKAQSSQALHIGNSGSDQENQPGGPKLSPDRGNTILDT